MCTEKQVLVKNKFTYGLNMGFPLPSQSEKTVHVVETQCLSGKKKFRWSCQ